MVSRTRGNRLGPFFLLAAVASAIASTTILQPQCNINPAQIGVNLFGWLTPDRLRFLQGGFFEWATGDGKVIVPQSQDWRVAFGDMTYQGLLNLLRGNPNWDAVFRWVNPTFIDVVHGGDFAKLFGWLDPGRLVLLQGGHWDPIKIQWITPGGEIIVPGTDGWIKYFGPHVLPGHLNLLFPEGGNWDDFFGWITPGFLQEHIHPENNPWLWVVGPPTQGFGTWTPDINTLFNLGKFKWLTPDRLFLLRGGYWDVLLNGWINPKGELIRPGTDAWTLYFDGLSPTDLLTLLNGRIRWDEVFGWFTPGVVQLLNSGPTPDWSLLFGWLTPERLALLRGGYFDFPSGHWVNGNGQHVVPGSPDWSVYFGLFGPDDVKNLFGNLPGKWEDFFGWITPEWITINIPEWNKWNPKPAPTPVTEPPKHIVVPPPPPPPVDPTWHIDIPQTWNWGQFGIPDFYIPWFTRGHFNWLTPDRLRLLQGGYWDAPNGWWVTVDGKQIRPNTPDWTVYFGEFQPRFLDMLFPHGERWDNVFGFLTPQFLNQWGTIIGGWGRPQFNFPGFQIPSQFLNFFQQGQMNWLTPDRFRLLQGGHWDPQGGRWITVNGEFIVPGSPQWNLYFGDLNPQLVGQWFAGGRGWGDVFGFLNPNFFNVWKGWQPQGGGFGGFAVPSNLAGFFQQGQMNWLNPDRFRLLQGGRWDGQRWITANGQFIMPGSPQWSVYFGDLNPALLGQWFAGGRGWGDVFGFINPGFFNNWKGWMGGQGQGGFGGFGGFAVPSNLAGFFQQGQMNWLTPERFKLLQGGRWDPLANRWITANGQFIMPGSPQWNLYFGSINPQFLGQLFAGGRGWGDVFGFMNPGFFQQWHGWQPGGLGIGGMGGMGVGGMGNIPVGPFGPQIHVGPGGMGIGGRPMGMGALGSIPGNPWGPGGK